METELPQSQKRLLLLALGLWSLLAIGIATSPSQLVYDEPYHIGLATLILKEGFFNALISPANQSAAGPLYAALQLAFEWATSLAAPGIRWIGFFCLLVTCILVSKTTFASNERFLSTCQTGICLLGIPFLWPCVGMALTEVPAMLFFSLALFGVARMITAENSHAQFFWAALAGLSLGVAILGRQTYLIILLVFCAWAVFHRKFLLPVLLLFVFAGLCSGWLFITWGGLVPPSQKAVDGGLRVDHALLAIVYLGVAGFILAPSILMKLPLRFIALFLIISGAVGFFAMGDEFVPAKTLLISIFGIDWAHQIGRLMLAIMFAISLLWFMSLFTNIISKRSPFLFLNFLILLAFIAAPAKISHLFSSRYVVTALIPLIFLTGFEKNKFAIALKVVGAFLGAGALLSYYKIH